MGRKSPSRKAADWIAFELATMIFARSQQNLTEPFGEKDYVISDTGLLLASGRLEEIAEGFKIAYRIAYAEDVEYGSEPHHVDLKDLHGWVTRKLELQGSHAWAVAKQIQKKIAEEGTEMRPYLRNATDLGVQDFIKKYRNKTIRLDKGEKDG